MSEAANKRENTQQKRVIGKPFQPGNPGRPKGARNKLGEKFLTDLLKLWEEKGNQALEDCLTADPVAFCRLVASIVPKELRVAVDPLEKASDDDIRRDIAAILRAVDTRIDGGIAAALGPAEPQGRAELPAEVPPLH